jgi:diacylglycerol kinase (ATP)
VAVIAHPAAGGGRAGRLVRPVLVRLQKAADVLAVDASKDPALPACDAVVVVGGDGSVHAALQRLALGDIPLGIVPAGSGNDLAALLGWPADPLRAADALADAITRQRVRRIDLGRTDAGRWWATVLCAGFDSAVAQTADRLRWPRGRRRYDVALVRELARLRARRVHLDLDGGRIDADVTLVAVGNGACYGGGRRITPSARLDDAQFAVTVVAPLGRMRLARLAPTVRRAAHVGIPEVNTYRTAAVRLDAAGTVAYADGEPIGPLPLTVRCVPAALPVLVP